MPCPPNARCWCSSSRETKAARMWGQTQTTDSLMHGQTFLSRSQSIWQCASILGGQWNRLKISFALLVLPKAVISVLILCISSSVFQHSRNKGQVQQTAHSARSASFSLLGLVIDSLILIWVLIQFACQLLLSGQQAEYTLGASGFKQTTFSSYAMEQCIHGSIQQRMFLHQ